MFKQILAFSLAWLVLLQTFSKTWIVVCFKLNEDYIAANLCEKKAVSRNNCQGKCQLKKQLEQTEAQNPAQAPSEAGKLSVGQCDLFVSLWNWSSPDPSIFSTSLPASLYLRVAPCGSFTDVFHPPSIA
jgi:hypothetical protein